MKDFDNVRSEQSKWQELKRFLKVMKFALWFLLIFVIVTGVAIIASLPMFKVKDGVIKRNLEYYMALFEDTPTGRNAAWDSELPLFVQVDIKYAEKFGYSINYTYHGANINIYWDEEEAKIDVDAAHSIPFDGLSNFSIYKDEKSNPIIYGYCYGRWFGVYEWEKFGSMYENLFYYSLITSDYNIPFDVSTEYAK